MSRSGSFAALIVLVAGFIIWSSALISLYALVSLGCRYGWGDSLSRLVPIVVWLVHIVGHTALIAWTWRRFSGEAAQDAKAAGFLKTAALLLAGAGLVATTWTGLPVLMVSACS